MEAPSKRARATPDRRVGSIHQATYVWNEAMPAWCEYSQSSLASGGTMPPGMRSVAF